MEKVKLSNSFSNTILNGRLYTIGSNYFQVFELTL